uniref:Uncharacterized protein n=1 Tax=Timema poppense TaxID=170557 RepID=A0A7R9CLS4_TIMPO|nr:unnamed protein product [Timema poppensis]
MMFCFGKGYVTYTPRLLLVDLKGSLGHLPEKGELYEQPLANPEIVPWPREKVEVLTEPTTLKNEFLQDIDEENVMDQDDGPTSKTVVQDALKVYKLENVVKVWADYLRQRFHPRTVSIINKYEHANDSQPFNNYKLGANLWNTEQFEEDFTDRIRNLVEECDNMQVNKLFLLTRPNGTTLAVKVENAAKWCNPNGESENVVKWCNLDGETGGHGQMAQP